MPATGLTPIAGYENVISGVDLSGITDTTIRLRANLATTDTNVTPALHDWTVTWQEPSTYVESAWSDIVLSTQDAASPTATQLLVKGTTWETDFLDYLDTQALGHPTLARLGYRIPTGAAQLDALSWANVDQITIVFSENVVVAESDLALYGVNVPTLGIDGFGYDAAAHAATWTLTEPLDTDRLRITLADAARDPAGNALDGEWEDATSTFPSGNHSPGGEFRFSFNVLPGDANHSGRVDDADAAILAAHWSPSGMSFLGDFNGDGLVNDRDASILAAHWRATLPPETEPLAGASPPGEPAPIGREPLVGPVLLGASGAPRRRIEPLPASLASAEARSEAAAARQRAARDAVFAETSDSGPDGETELLRHRLAWSYELAQTRGQKRSGRSAGPDGGRVDALLAAGIM